jgi:hypothetical protein
LFSDFLRTTTPHLVAPKSESSRIQNVPHLAIPRPIFSVSFAPVCDRELFRSFGENFCAARRDIVAD